MRWELALCTVSMLTLGSAACTHTKPYFGEEAEAPDSIQVPEDQVMQRVLLVGDTGEPQLTGCDSEDGCEPVLQVLEHWASKRPGGRRPFVLFLGDNIYPGGLPDEKSARRRSRAEAKLRAQTAVLINSEARGTFIPGNHDWGGTFGFYHEDWVRQYEFLKQAGQRQEEKYGQSYLLVPEMESGCPWPVNLAAGELEGLTIIVLDSQWWLTPDDLKEAESCARTSAAKIGAAQARVVSELARMLKAAGENQVIVATHHPMASHGLHGAWYRFFSQDIRGSQYQVMIKALRKAYHDSGARPLIHAAGHDHSLQVLKGEDESNPGQVGAQYNLVSGAGSQAKLQGVWHDDDTLFAHQHAGFMVVDVMRNGDVFLQVIEPEDSEAPNPEGRQVYATQLH